VGAGTNPLRPLQKTSIGEPTMNTATKNTCAKSRPVTNPYEIWVEGGWEWRVLKKYQAPHKEKENPYARWFCAVKSPYTFGSYDMGDVYCRDIIGTASRIS